MIDEDKLLEKLKIKIAVSNLQKENTLNSNEKSAQKWRFQNMKKIIATVIIALMAMFGTVFAYERITPPNKSSLSFKAIYKGEGKIDIVVENNSNKVLNFEKDIKLMRWFTSEEISKISDYIEFENTSIKQESSGVMTIDISKMYDLEMLEKPLEEGDHYYLVLTTDNYIFGNDFHCSIKFTDGVLENESKKDIVYEDMTQIPQYDNNTNVSSFDIIDELKPYFADYVINPTLRNEKIGKYYQEVDKIISKEKENGKNIASTVNPFLFIKDPAEGVVFDDRVSSKLQYQLIGEHHYSTSAYNIPVGSYFDECLVLSTYIPQSERDIRDSGGAELPLVYIYQYERKEIEKPNTFAFIYGRLISFEDLERFKVYEDKAYVCYDCTDFFYSDLAEYVDIFAKFRSDIYIDDGVNARIQNVYNYLRNAENLRNSFYYHKY